LCGQSFLSVTKRPDKRSTFATSQLDFKRLSVVSFESSALFECKVAPESFLRSVVLRVRQLHHNVERVFAP
jgi:hypothetical protein